MTRSALDVIFDSPTYAIEWRGVAKAVRPRDAATLVIVRRDTAKPRVLMGRRNSGHSFMPEKWVFPGGRIDRADFRAPYADDLRPDVADHLLRTTTASRGRALALTAIRETFEETGLIVGCAAAARPFAGPWRDYLAQGALADLSVLDFIARAITPPDRAKRFDARFFMVDARHLLSFERLPDCGELDDIAWLDLDEAAELNLAGITRFVLQDLKSRLDDPSRPAHFSKIARGVRVLTDI